MSRFAHINSEFLNKVVAIIEAQMADESFGVSELADQVGMSRSNLLRRVQKLTGLSVSVLIREVRLDKAQQLLKDDSLNVSEVAYQVGFNSVSYFVKCYRELFGYPPGEEAVQVEAAEAEPQPESDSAPPQKKMHWGLFASMVALLSIISLSIIFWPEGQAQNPQPLEKSIAVLPFQNDSADSSNVYIVNGLMEAILTNLQKIEDLRVISRTSVEKYRGSKLNIAEISEELDVNYFIEGSGQKIGDQLLLSIQLIEAPRDKHLWSEQYNRQLVDIFSLQAEVAKDIAQEIQVFVSPEEVERIEKIPTENLEAYDEYLKGLELVHRRDLEGLKASIDYFKAAIALDPDFALPHAYIAFAYYYIDIFQAQKQYGEEINRYADRALVLDAELPQSLIAKGVYHMQGGRYDLAAEYFEKVLQYNPNSAEANNFLSEIYNSFKPDTERYLRYALRGVQLETSGYDSTVVSFSYLHLGNALIQNGFVEEAEKYILRSLAYDPNNLFSQYVYAYILLAKDNDIARTRKMIAQTFEQDSTRLDVLQELAKVCYYQGDYEAAYAYYSRFDSARTALNMDIFTSEDLLIGYVYAINGHEARAKEFYASYKQYVDQGSTVYKELGMASYHALHGNIEEGISSLKRFSEHKRIQYWYVKFLDNDPIMDRLKVHPEYQAITEKISEQFWQGHREMRQMLEEANLL